MIKIVTVNKTNYPDMWYSYILELEYWLFRLEGLVGYSASPQQVAWQVYMRLWCVREHAGPLLSQTVPGKLMTC